MTVWKAQHNEISSTQLSEFQARNKRDFSRKRNGPYQLGRQQGIKITWLLHNPMRWSVSPQLSDHCHYPTHFPASSSHHPQQIRSTVGLTCLVRRSSLFALHGRTFMLSVSTDNKYPNRLFFTLKCAIRCIVLVTPSLTGVLRAFQPSASTIKCK